MPRLNNTAGKKLDALGHVILLAHPHKLIVGQLASQPMLVAGKLALKLAVMFYKFTVLLADSILARYLV